ncbi:hypothetical protein DMH20_09225 [Escherichia coli]|nr:hypothetical protein [Escherichia coli]
MFAEDCTGKGLNRPDNRRFFQVVKRGAVNDSIGQGETMPVPLAWKGETVFTCKGFLITCRYKNDAAVYDSAIIQFT